MIYNRLHEGMPLGIDATIRFATGNYTKPLTESELAIDSPYNTPHQRRPAAGADQQPRPGRDRSRRAPGEDRLPLLREQARTPATSSTFAKTEAEFEADVAKYEKAREAAGGNSPTPAGNERRCRGSRCSATRSAHSRSPAMQNAALAELGAGGEWSYEAIDVAPDDFEATRRASWPRAAIAGANVTVPHKEAALALADEASEAARAIGAANTLTFADGRIDGRQHRRRRPARRAAGLAARARGRWCSAPAAPPGRSLWALAPAKGREVDVWNRTASAGRGVCAELGGTAGARAPSQADYALIVNTTAVGLARRGPLRAPAARAAAASPPGRWSSTWSTASSRAPCCAAAGAAGAATSTASRSSSSRAPSRCRSGPAASPTSTSMRAAARAIGEAVARL